MKVRFYWDSGANIHSAKTSVVDVSDLGYTADEWREMPDDEKHKEAEIWAWNNGLEIGYEEID